MNSLSFVPCPMVVTTKKLPHRRSPCGGARSHPPVSMIRALLAPWLLLVCFVHAVLGNTEIRSFGPVLCDGNALGRAQVAAAWRLASDWYVYSTNSQLTNKARTQCINVPTPVWNDYQCQRRRVARPAPHDA